MRVRQGTYDIEEFCQAILDTSEDRLFENLHVHQIKILLYLTSTDDWQSIFEDYDSQNYGDVIKFTKDYRNRVGEMDEAVFFVTDYSEDVLMVFTGAVEDAIRQTLDSTESNHHEIEPMPIFPSDFQEMNSYVLNNYSDMEISDFKSVSQPDLAEADIRPEVQNRTIEYGAPDGREAMAEMREYYGVVPVRVQYEHNDIEFRMDTEGKFTLSTINERTFNLFFRLIEEVVGHIINIQEVSEEIRFRTETRRSGDLDLEVPRLRSGEIRFTKEFNLLMVEHFIDHLSSRQESPYTFSDINKQAGSLDLSARVTDEQRESRFNISASEDSMTIVPKRNCTWGSILQFYHQFTQTVDENSRLKLFSGNEDEQAS